MIFLIILCFRPTNSLSSKQQDTNAQQRNYTSTLTERNESFTKLADREGADYGYASASRFRPIDKDVSGAAAIRVQDIPNGAVGRPVEFESTFCLVSIFRNSFLFVLITNLLHKQLMARMLVPEIWKF